MIKINVSEEIKNVWPDFSGVAIFAQVKNTPHNEALWKEIDSLSKEYKTGHQIEDIKKNPAIAATREAYKKFGKDPNRYRPSSEALCRRILRDLPLYRIDTLVDLINLVSIKTGYSIGGFDADKIQGDTLTLGIGRANEPYEGIGKGILNIEGLPVYRDSRGGIGTPTSDHERTKISPDTGNFLALINGYSGKDGLADAAGYMRLLLKKYTDSDGGEIMFY
jgi:DNA/RNA-binding domain of Phe-tRNA-synthetase-like protein